MRAPEFWRHSGGAMPALLSPLGLLYGTAARLREAAATPWRAPVPIVCVGNLTVGGAGKTPTALALGAILRSWKLRVMFLTRGYGGRLRGPVEVDPARHGARDVGDEPLLLAARAPTWVARDRKDGARAAIADGADVVIMDDGLQNPALRKDLRLVVVDGGAGFGNERVLPAGPLREPLARGLARASAFVLIGDDERGLAPRLARHAPVLRVRLVPDARARALAGVAVHAFAGIARPEKFFATLAALGARVAGTHAFADHHPYSEAELALLADAAARAGAILVTTAKDFVRVPERRRAAVTPVGVDLVFDEPKSIESLLRAAMMDAADAERRHG